MQGLRERIMAQCTGRLVRVNLPTAGASVALLPGSLQRVAVAFPPTALLAAFRTEPLTSAADGISPQAGWSQPIVFDLWTYGRIVQAPWFAWALQTGVGYVIEVVYPGRLELPAMADDVAGVLTT